MPAGKMFKLVSDTSAWIAYFAGRDCPLLEAGLAAGTVEIPAMVKLELLGNVLTAKDRKSLEQTLAGLTVLSMNEEHITRAGRLKASLEEKGTAISARDAHILQCAIDQDAILISNDPLFVSIQKSAGVRVQVW